MAKTINEDDPRLAGYSSNDKREIINQYAIRAKAEPELKEYKRKYGHCKVPRSYDEIKGFADWVKNQRQHRPSEDRVAKLNSIGFIWEIYKK
eukprot:scaffold369583_cov185-Cyclotella_meneghiniana.AAC.1